MSRPDLTDLDRRRFLQLAGLMAAGLLDGCGSTTPKATHDTAVHPTGFRVALVRDPADAVAMSPPAQWALAELETQLKSKGASTRRAESLGLPGSADLSIVVRSAQNAAERPDSLAIIPVSQQGQDTLRVAAPNPRGLAYGLSELAERVYFGAEAREALRLSAPIVERPANRIRSVIRMFVSDVEDKGWFHDRSFWPRYFQMLASQRFNRFNLSLGLGYDAPQRLRDAYFYFPYPFLLKVPGYDVRAVGLPDEERDKNLQSLRFIGQTAAAYGLDFQLGLWTHAYQWQDSPDVNYVIEGLTPATQAPYCRDALQMLLEACLPISGLTFRTHGESGVAEGSYEFWRTLFSAIVAVKRPINIDLHAKGIDQRMIDVALATNLPVTVSPKFWAEHMGLPYLQSSIREEEMPRQRPGNEFFSLSNGARSFMRYSYGDLFKSDRRYGILHRVWPGTQRLLLWGDPALAAGYGRIFHQCGADGVEYFDPLSFKGRKGSGLPGGRGGYSDVSLRAAGGDWEKYLYAYRLWGRLGYNPDAEPDVWRRLLMRQFGAAAELLESALAASSRILPLITSAHDPSAANANYWPEIYLNMSIVDPSHPGSYTDTPRPRVFGTVSSLDPQIFATVDEYAQSLLDGTNLARYTPVDVANQLDDWARSSGKNLLADSTNPDYRRVAIDAGIAAGVGGFFASKFRAAVLYAIFDRTGSEEARVRAVQWYSTARTIWAELAGRAGVYASDLTFGPDPQLRGHWRDRLPAIARDITAMTERAPANAGDRISTHLLDSILAAVGDTKLRKPIPLQHVAPASFRPGEVMAVELRDPRGKTASARLWYRQMNQSEPYHWQQMVGDAGSFHAAAPAEYTDSKYPMQYYFEVVSDSGKSGLYPGLGQDFLGQPYFIVQPGR